MSRASAADKGFFTRDDVCVLLTRIPYSEHISHVESTDEELRFTWRGDRFRISLKYGSVETVEGKFLTGGNLSILMESLLKRAYADLLMTREREKTAVGA